MGAAEQQRLERTRDKRPSLLSGMGEVAQAQHSATSGHGLMKRFLISISVGTSITFIPAIVVVFFVNHSDLSSVFAFTLYGPSTVIQRLGFGPDCVDANSISEKLSCMRFGFVVDLIIYPLVICGASLMTYFILFRRERRIRLSPVNKTRLPNNL